MKNMSTTDNKRHFSHFLNLLSQVCYLVVCNLFAYHKNFIKRHMQQDCNVSVEHWAIFIYLHTCTASAHYQTHGLTMKITQSEKANRINFLTWYLNIPPSKKLSPLTNCHHNCVDFSRWTHTSPFAKLNWSKVIKSCCRWVQVLICCRGNRAH